MKILTLFLSIILGLSSSYAQKNPINFEAGGFGADWTWTVFENDTNPNLDIIDNPDPSGINSSSKVARFTALVQGNPPAGCESAHGNSDLGPFVLGANNSIIKIMVWKSVISDVGIKLVAAGGWAEQEIKISNTKINEWEELTFNFSSRMNPPQSEGQFDQIVIFPDFNIGGRTQDNIIYFDNITFGNNEGNNGDEPMTAAPTPTRDSLNVISLFSDAYTDVPVDTWRTDWSSAELEDIEIQGNPTKKYSNLDFVGIETVANQIDITDMNHIHLDIWTPNMTTFRLKLVDFGPNGTFDGPGNGDDTEGEYIIENPAQGQWLSVNLPLTDFPTLTTKANIAQIILSGLPVAQGVVYVDNVYFYYQEPGALDEPMTAAPTPTREAADVISLYSDAYTDVPVDTWRTDWSSAELEDIEIQGNPTKKYSNLDFVGIETVANQIDITGMNHIHLDIWTPNMTTFRLKLVDFGPNGAFDGPGNGDDTEGEYIFENPAQGQWIGVDLPLTDFPTLTSKANIAQIILSGLPVAQGVVYVDNVYFYYQEPGTLDEPMTAAPTPTREASGVISLYSDAYTDVPVDTWRTEWSSAELEDIEIQGNPTKKYSNLDFVGIETVANQIDITGMTHVHLDIWTPNMTTFRLKLVDFGPNGTFDGPGNGDDREGEYIIENPSKGQWLSVDLPLTDFPTLTSKANIAQIILSGLPVAQGVVYVDNVYFYDVTTSTYNTHANASSLKVYPNPLFVGQPLFLDIEVKQYELCNINGQIISRGTSNTISTESLQRGIYIVNVMANDGRFYSERIIIK